MDIAGKAFLVTGGGSGLGEATVRMLAEAGGQVIVADTNAETGEAVAAAVGARARFVPCDVTSEEQVQAAVTRALDEFGNLHGAVNCAGVAMAMKVLSSRGPHPLEVFGTVVNINLVGTFNVTRLAAAAIAAQPPDAAGERGIIVNTASIAAYEGQVGQAAYAASKGGIVAMTLPLARELARHAIRVVTMAPGVFDTPLMRMLPQQALGELARQVPFPSRLGDPAEFALLVRHAIENPMLNGTTIRIDGALRMG